MRRIILFSIICLSASLLQAQLTIIVNSVPADTPSGDLIYVAGSFQGWDPGDPDYALTDNEDGTYQITISPPAGTLTFKFTRGAWANVEGNESGQFLPDRTYEYSGAEESVTYQILTWEDTGGPNSTAAENVTVISTEFYMPELDRYRKIWIYLPPEYDSTVDDYPVMYMHDGQNVFDQATSFAGEWEVDETLNELYGQGDPGIIVVAIDNGGALRIDEYSPWVNPDYGGGEGDAYIQFITNTLKPYIDANYRTLADREHTALMGSSLGGLISHYGGVQYEETFSKVGIFSPSYWFADESYTLVTGHEHALPSRIYMIAGGMESGSMVSDAEDMIDTFLASGYAADELNFETHADGQHSEWYWAREFGAAYQWLFAETTGLSDVGELGRLEISPNPMVDILHLNLPEELKESVTWELYDLRGVSALTIDSMAKNVDVSGIPVGLYFLKASSDTGKVRIWKVLKLDAN